MFDVNYDENLNQFEICDISEYPHDIDAPIKQHFEKEDYGKIFDDLNIAVLMPINNYEDFIFSHESTDYLNGFVHNYDSSIGRSILDIFPFIRDEILTIFKRVLATGELKSVGVCFYENDVLEKYFELKITSQEDKIFLFVDDKTKSYVLKGELNYSFEHEFYPKAIIQDGKVVKINKAYSNLFNSNLDEINKFSLDQLSYRPVIYNDTGLVLSFSQIVDFVLNDDYPSIRYSRKFISPSFEKTFLAVARKLKYNNKPAVLITCVKELDEEDKSNFTLVTDILNIIQHSAKNTFIIYDYKNDSYTWGEGIENLFDCSIAPGYNLREFLPNLIAPYDLEKMIKYEKKIILNKIPYELSYNIKTLKGVHKIIHVSTDIIEDDNGEISKILYLMDDITDYQLKNDKLERLTTTFNNFQEANAISVHYLTPNGSYVWTEESYNLIDREPRPNDNSYNIILDLMKESEREKLEEEIDSLEPNKFLGKRRIKITTESGKSKILELDVHKLYDNQGNFIQKSAYARDITDKYSLEKENALSSEIRKTVLDHLNVGIMFVSSEFEGNFSDGFYNITGLEKNSDLDIKKEFENNIISEDISKKVNALLNKETNLLDVTYKYNVPGTKKSKYITQYMTPYNFDGEELYIGAIQDVTDQLNYENDLTEASEERFSLVKEIHHRVKNNLQIITSFISLEERFNKGDPERVIEVTKNRINALALIHERIHTEENINMISLKSFMADFDIQTKKLFGKEVNFVNEINEDLAISIDSMTPLVLITNELTNNSFKYAFNKSTDYNYNEIFKNVEIIEKDGKSFCKFHYADNGRGLDEEYNLDEFTTLGWTIIKSLVNQLDGEFEVFNDGGFNFIFEFPII